MGERDSPGTMWRAAHQPPASSEDPDFFLCVFLPISVPASALPFSDLGEGVGSSFGRRLEGGRAVVQRPQ